MPMPDSEKDHGDFARGEETEPPSEHEGDFAEGQEGEHPDHPHHGSFAEGQEEDPEHEDEHEGSFAEGQEEGESEYVCGALRRDEGPAARRRPLADPTV